MLIGLVSLPVQQDLSFTLSVRKEIIKSYLAELGHLLICCVSHYSIKIKLFVFTTHLYVKSETILKQLESTVSWLILVLILN